MIDLRVVITILFVHWVADFIMQTDDMARNKSKCNIWLSKHILSYSIVMLLTWLLLYYFSLKQLLPWIVINGLLHFIIDYVTSRVTSYLWVEKEVHNFFVVIGLDQMLHVICLLTTFVYLVKNEV